MHVSTAEAVKMFGAENLKIYESRFINMYHAVMTRKSRTVMKLICEVCLRLLVCWSHKGTAHKLERIGIIVRAQHSASCCKMRID